MHRWHGGRGSQEQEEGTGGAEGGAAPEKQRGMEMMNQREMREKKAVRGMAPEEPVCTSRMLRQDSVASVMPGK